MDFCEIRQKETKGGGVELIPNFMADGNIKDLMILGGKFYAIWDEEAGLWSTNAHDVQRFVDAELREAARKFYADTGIRPQVRYLKDSNSKSRQEFNRFVAETPDIYHPLNSKLVFANSEVKKEDYASFRLPYALAEGDTSAWDELLSVLYTAPERAKIEWTIGSIIDGASKRIQKFVVFYGPGGSGKSTILRIIEGLVQGYWTSFSGKDLGRGEANFATEAFKDNPLAAIQHDADLSRIEDNTRLNSIIAHEPMVINEKYKAQYISRIDSILILGTNTPVKITDAKSGVIRRLIDIHPTGVRHPNKKYHALMDQIVFEYGAIAHHCLQVFRAMGPGYYDAYVPFEMMLQTDPFLNFIEAYYDVFKQQDYTTMDQAYELYKEFCDESGIRRQLTRPRMRDELRNYFDEFQDRAYIDGKQIRSVYRGFNSNHFIEPKDEDKQAYTLVMEETKSLFDEVMADCSAQLASPSGTMYKKWNKVRTKLSDIETGELHWVKVPGNHIVIDFDLGDSNGTSALERNLEAASHWPSTYGEISKSGKGVHLHYTYVGDPAQLATAYSDGIEVKTLQGDGALRRKLTRCNAVPIASISSGLPLKKKEKMLQTKTINSERGLRELIERNLRKEIHPGTKPSVDFIKKILDDAYESDMPYDLSDLRPRIMAFANNSTNQAANCLKIVQEMKWSSENPGEEFPAEQSIKTSDERLAFFDVEVYSNLFVVCWKFQGDANVVRMINPTAAEVEALFKLKLVGFYNRRYDNHILYAASMGKSPAELFKLSAKLIEGNRSVTYGAAYSLSYADIWDFSSEKMSLKKFEIKLGILHMELDIPWDQPVPEDKWDLVVEYCVNDVRATEKVFEDRKGDFTARRILAELSGLTVNDTTQNHTAKIIFGDDKNPQKQFVYTDLSEEFPGYTFTLGKSSYKGIDPGEGGYVYAEPGMYENVAVIDVLMMHPTSIEKLNLFGKYTQNFSALKLARNAIKHGDFDAARKMMDGRLEPYLDDETHASQLAYALKIVVNTVYGLTSAKFDNAFRDIRNIDNIAAKRGALFMIDLQDEVQKSGYTVAHIKTDSIKIPNADEQAIGLVKTIGSMYGYEFEHEGTYERFCLVNDAVFIALKDGQWEAVGAQFAHPYVFKKLFSKEPIGFDDMCEARSVVKGTMYLDISGSDLDQPDKSQMRHVGRTGLFVPVKQGGGVLYRVSDDKYYAVSGTKGHMWMEAPVAQSVIQDSEIDKSYFEKLVDEAVKTIEKFGDFHKFTER